jgi:hypothetical protein
VEAPDEAAAIAHAIEEFAIEQQYHNRLIAVRRA